MAINTEPSQCEALQLVRGQLFSMADPQYRSFHCKLIPNVPPELVIGIRTPTLRDFARTLASSPMAAHFMHQLPHTYYEENNLHGMLIERMSDYDQTIATLNEFLPYVDNWATCDLLRPKIFRKNRTSLLEQIKTWISSQHTYTCRFGLEMLMVHFLDDDFQPEYLEMAAQVDSEDYYLRMMSAWFFATALAKQYRSALTYLEEYRLSPWIHNKTIQKAVESYRLTQAQKDHLRTLKIRRVQ